MENEKIELLEARIVQLEKEVELLKGERKMRQLPSSEKINQPIETREPPLSDMPDSNYYTKKEKEETDWETLIGKIWLPRIFIFVLLLGVVWGFRIAVDAGWLNETARIIIGFIAAGLFFYIGEKQIQNKRAALGKVLLVGFISTLLVTTFSMHILYEMIPTAIAFPLNIVWIILGLYLAHRHHSQAMGVMFAIAGYFIPFLVAGSGDLTTGAIVITYELIYYLALLWFAIRNQYRVLFYASTVFLHVVYLVIILTSGQVLDRIHILMITLGILIQHEVIFYTLVKGKIEKLKAFSLLFTSLIITFLWAKLGFIAYGLEYLFTIYALASTLRYGWVSYQAKIKQNTNMFSISVVAVTLGVSVLILDVVENQYLMASLFLIQGALAVYVGYTFQSKTQKVLGYFIYYGITMIIINVPFIDRWEDLVLWAILITTLFFQVFLNKKGKDKILFIVNISIFLFAHVLFLTVLDTQVINYGPLYWLAIIGSLYSLYRLNKDHLNTLLKQIYNGINIIIHLLFISYLAGEFVNGSTNTEVLFTTAGWAIYALICVYLGMKREHKQLRLLGIGLIFFTLLKLIFFDLAFISLTTRSILFVFIGLIGIIVSRFIYGNKA